MATIVTRAGKGSPLTNTEVDANFTNLNTDLGNKMPTGGGTATGDLTMAGYKLINAVAQRPKDKRATATISGGVLALDLDNGLIDVSLNANVVSMTFSNNDASATVGQAVLLTFTADGTARSITWPNGDGSSTLKVQHPGGTAPTPTSTNGKKDKFLLVSESQYLWTCLVVGQNV